MKLARGEGEAKEENGPKPFSFHCLDEEEKLGTLISHNVITNCTILYFFCRVGPKPRGETPSSSIGSPFTTLG